MNDLMKLVRTYRLTSGLSQRLTLAEQIFRLIEPDLQWFLLYLGCSESVPQIVFIRGLLFSTKVRIHSTPGAYGLAPLRFRYLLFKT